MDYIYGEVNTQVRKNEYIGGETNTIKVNVDNATNIISAILKDDLLVVVSPNGTKYKIVVDNSGNLSTIKI